MNEHTERVYRWANLSTTEDLQRSQDYDIKDIVKNYYWTPKAKELSQILLLGQPGLIGVVALQGVGKTMLRVVIKEELKKRDISTPVYMMEWDNEEDKSKIIDSYIEGVTSYVQQLGEELFRSKGRKDFDKILIKYKIGVKSGDTRKKIIDFFDLNINTESKDIRKHAYHGELLEIFEKELKKRQIEKIRENIYLDNLRAGISLIDLPDYPKNSGYQMFKHLKEIEFLWQNAAYGNIVIFLQKELFERYGHFLFGKMKKIELESLASSTLVNMYLKRFSSEKPFIPEALQEVAKASQGVFRRFLRYIVDCINKMESDNKEEIDLDIVRSTITLNKIAEDMDTELTDLFPQKKEHRLKAVQILERLKRDKEILQNILVKELFEGRRDTCSRFLDRLEAMGYINKIPKGKSNVISLKEKGV